MIKGLPSGILREGIWSFHTGKNQGEGSERLQQILGLDPAQVSFSPEIFRASVHPGDKETWETSWKNLLTAPEETEWEWDGRIQTPKGGWKWIHLTGRRRGDRVLGSCEDVTRTRELELRLKEREDHWAALVDALPVTLRIVNSKGTIMFVNSRPEPGNRLELASQFTDLFSGPEQREAQEFLGQIFRKTSIPPLSTSATVGLSTRYFSHTAALLPGGNEALVVSMDVTQHHRWEHLQLLEQDRLQALVYAQSLPREEERETIWFLLDTAIHLSASSGAFFGEVQEDPRILVKFALRDNDTTHWEESRGIRWDWSSLVYNRGNVYSSQDSGEYLTTLGIDRKDTLMVVPIATEGRVRALVGVMGKAGQYEEEEVRTFELFVQGIWEILQRKRTEQALILSQRIETIGQMAAGVAHDFNNLLAAILGFTTLAKMRIHNPETLGPVLEKIESAGQKGAQLVQSVLNFGRKQEFHPTPLDLAEHLVNSNPLYTSLLPSVQKFSLALFDRTLQILGDPDLLDQAVLNLISNARDALESTGTPNPQIWLEAGRWTDPPPLFSDPPVWHGPWVYLRVRDNGPGIPKAVQERLFEPFFTTKPVGKGTGLGLPVVKNIVTQHRGHIILTSDRGKETSFTLFLPQIPIQEK